MYESNEITLLIGEGEDVTWAEPKYPRKQVNAAAELVVAAASPEAQHWDSAEWDSYLTAVGVVNNWRASHSYPLNTFQMNLRNTAARFDQAALVAQRTKRLRSIIHKLERFPKMKLTQMQDLGGCRAILANVATVHNVARYYQESSSIKHELASKDDYIASPKTSGYRGVHLVYRYFSDKPTKAVYNGLKIEIQLRSTYQHAWATAVETVSMFSGQALKSSQGSERWQRFFSLMGSVIAAREKCPPVPNTPVKRGELRSELAELVESLNVADRLKEYGRALRHLEDAVYSGAGKYYLLQLDPRRGELRVQAFSARELSDAEERYSEAENLVRADPSMDAVLVSVDSIIALQRAYPNYFADTRVFVQLLNQALSGHARGITLPAVTALGKATNNDDRID